MPGHRLHPTPHQASVPRLAAPWAPAPRPPALLPHGAAPAAPRRQSSVGQRSSRQLPAAPRIPPPSPGRRGAGQVLGAQVAARGHVPAGPQHVRQQVRRAGRAGGLGEGCLYSSPLLFQWRRGWACVWLHVCAGRASMATLPLTAASFQTTHRSCASPCPLCVRPPPCRPFSGKLLPILLERTAHMPPEEFEASGGWGCGVAGGKAAGTKRGRQFIARLGAPAALQLLCPLQAN